MYGWNVYFKSWLQIDKKIEVVKDCNFFLILYNVSYEKGHSKQLKLFLKQGSFMPILSFCWEDINIYIPNDYIVQRFVTADFICRVCKT